MNLLEKNIRGSMGMVIQTLSYLIVDPETLKPVPPGTQGMLLVRGPSVFGGYLGKEDSPFVAVNGHHDWYRTGDLVIELPDHPRFLVFKGRLKRFIKKGGEMVSLPAIEEVLAPFFPPGRDGEPRHAVTAFGEDGQADLEVVLFSVDSVDRESVNRRILESGLSGLHRVDRVVTIAEIPLLGTGKTNYRGLLRPE
jgi:long-chain-fatty-acid--[acyl-carrier-protein] ligase